jgi:hypothetical protein
MGRMRRETTGTRRASLLGTGLLLIGWSCACSRGSVGPPTLRDGGRQNPSDDGSSTPPSNPPVLTVRDAQGLEAPALGACSRDLHSRLDGNGNVVEVCPPDQACLDNACVPACDAFAAMRGNVGCDFLIPHPPMVLFQTGCFAVFAANNWTRPAKLTVSRSGVSPKDDRFARVSVAGQPETSWPVVPSTGLPVDQVAVLFLEGSPTLDYSCPVEAAVATSSSITTTGRGHAWHIVSDTPVSVYDIVPYGGALSAAPSGELLFPTTSWSTNYVAVVPMVQKIKKTGYKPGVQWGQIIASQDDTVVKIVPSVGLPSGSGVSAAPENSVTTYTLSAGETIQWSRGWGNSLPLEMTGSILSSNRPIAFEGGNDYLCIASATSDDGGCDSAHQQIPPVSALGSKYAAAPYATRRPDGKEESLWYRIVGMQDATVLTYDPPIPGAPSTLRQGEWSDFEVTGAFVVSSQDNEHPFYVAQTMSGWGVTGTNQGLGDEEYVNLVPPAQFLSSYVFFTDATYTTTTLSLAQCDEGRGWKDVQVRCLGTVTGWKPIGTNSKCRWTTVTLVNDSKAIGNCQNGPQRASSEEPFGLVVWGIAFAASYAYPAGALVTPINKIVIPPVIR